MPHEFRCKRCGGADFEVRVEPQGRYLRCVPCRKKRCRESARTHALKKAIQEGRDYLPKRINRIVRNAIRNAVKTLRMGRGRYKLIHLTEREKANRYYHTVKKHRPAERVRSALQSRIRTVLKGGKSVSIFKVLGCDLAFLKRWIENQFVRGMTWENYGRVWHIDHIVPCSAFDFSKPAEQAKCFHYSNLRPLWAFDNLSKGDRVVTCQPELTLPLHGDTLPFPAKFLSTEKKGKTTVRL